MQVSVSCLESFVRRTFLGKFDRRLHSHKGVPCFSRQESILREGRLTRVHIVRDKNALEVPPRFIDRVHRCPLHACLVCFWDSELF